MVQFLLMTEASARGALRDVGVQIIPETDPHREIVLVEALGPDSLVDRATIDIVPPAPGDEFSDMGAWHVRPQAEAHSVLSGRGLVEFITPQGLVPVIVEAGDIMVVQGAEHRYLPLTDQRWILRWSGGPDAAFEGTNTDREARDWTPVR